jgi:Holliday junction resolvasome RuvABC ATP-dependent DNA helicase subunit
METPAAKKKKFNPNRVSPFQKLCNADPELSDIISRVRDAVKNDENFNETAVSAHDVPRLADDLLRIFRDLPNRSEEVIKYYYLYLFLIHFI